MELTNVSLFSGIGGMDLGAEAAGIETRAQVEINPFAEKSSLLDSRTPSNSATSGKLRGGDLLKACNGRPTILSGGFPCQPVSLAGNRKGSKDTRWLWPEYLRLIRELKPYWIVAENVAALLSLPEFAGIHADIKAEGYEIGILILSAADVGAPHQRKRCFVVAHTNSDGLQETEVIKCGCSRENPAFGTLCGSDKRGLHQTLNPDSLAGFQENTCADTEREGRHTRDGLTGFTWSGFPLPDWSGYPSAICRMDDGAARKMDRPRLQAVGNAVCPRQVFPIYETIARIERGF